MNNIKASKVSKILFAAVIFITTSSVASATSESKKGQVTTFNQALALAYNNNPSLKSSRENLKATDEDMFEAVSGFLPDVSASYNRGRRNTDTGSSDSGENTDNRSINITQPLFRGGQTISQIKGAKNNILSSRAILQNTEQQILLEAISAYMDVVRDIQVLELSENNLSVLKKHLEATKDRFDLGGITRTDVAQSESSVASAMAEKIQSSGTLAASKAAYRRIIGAEPTNLQAFKNPVDINASLDEIIEIALEENPLIKSAKYDELTASSNVTREKGKLFPSVDLLASKQKQEGAQFSGGGDLDTETIELSVSIPLYQKGTEYSSIRRHKSALNSSKYNLLDQKNKVRESVIKAYNDYQVARSTIDANKAVVKASKIALDGTTKEAEFGARTTLDVLDAKQDLFEARINLIRSKRDEIVHSYNLLAQIGKLNAKSLKLDVTPYDVEENYKKKKYQLIGF